jgi:hypothetical protein
VISRCGAMLSIVETISIVTAMGRYGSSTSL